MSFKGDRALLAFGLLLVAVLLFVFLSTGNDDDASDESVVATSTTTTDPSGGGTDNSGSQPDDDKPEPEPDKPEPPVIEVKNGQPVGGVKELSYNAGDRIEFTVESDIDENVHLHGYDIEQPVKAGGKTTFDLDASIEGVFEVELEESVVPIAEITVNPS